MKIGIMGTGDISRAFLKSAQELKLNAVAVLSREMTTAKDFAQLYCIPYFSNDLTDFLSSGIDLVYIGLPNSLHYENARACLLKKKHVLLEKPLVLKYTQYEELLEIATKNQVMLLEVDRVSFLPNYLQIKKTINDTVRLIQVDFCKQSRRFEDYMMGELPHIFDAKYGGGALYDLGGYGFHFITGLLGEPNELNYICQKGRGNADMMGIVTLSYPNCLATITLSKISHGDSRVLIQGEDFRICSHSAPSKLIDLEIMQNGKVTIYHDGGNNFTHFLKQAIQIIKDNNLDEYHRQIVKSKSVLKLLEKAENMSNGIF